MPEGPRSTHMLPFVFQHLDYSCSVTAVDTACSSSLVGSHMACLSMREGACSTAATAGDCQAACQAGLLHLTAVHTHAMKMLYHVAKQALLQIMHPLQSVAP